MHTPGPWRATHDGYISSDNGYVPMVTPFREDAHRDRHRNPTPEAMANARLIASAPDLKAQNERYEVALEKRLNEIRRLETVNAKLLEALGRLVSKPAPFCEDWSTASAVCPYCDCTEHTDDCDWLLAQQVWVDIKNREAKGE